MTDHFARAPKRPQHRRELLSVVVVVLVAVGIWLLSGRDPGTPTGTGEDGAVDPRSGLPVVQVDELPAEAEETLDLIDEGGPFPYEQDGSRFGNYEGLLPDEPLGYYAEYTVETPGLSHRGARRIVTGSDGEEYWTEDHYDSFAVIAE